MALERRNIFLKNLTIGKVVLVTTNFMTYPKLRSQFAILLTSNKRKTGRPHCHCYRAAMTLMYWEGGGFLFKQWDLMASAGK